MKLNCSRQELLLIAMAVVIGVLLRASHTDQLAVEHFDEGIYSSTMWYDVDSETPYPERQLYAPPLLPTLIGLLAAVPGLQDVAPFLPSLVLGGLTVCVLWWLARSIFGQAGGLFIVFVAAFSDFHILFSRMALTDVPVLFWTSLAVTLGLKGLQARSAKTMILAGFLTGLAWWTKYTGWLALAIIVSGAAFWWLLRGRQQMGLLTLLKLLLAMTLAAFITWTPWLWMLQQYGGYEAVAENHRGYFAGFKGWQDRLSSHIVYHFRIDSWLGAGSLGIGLLAAGTRRWIELKRSTWNSRTDSPAINANAPSTEVGTNTAALSAPQTNVFPSATTPKRYVLAAIVLGIIGLGIGSVGLLTCLAIGGMAGLFLWPVMNDQYQRRINPSAYGTTFPAADLNAAPVIDPSLGASVVLAWFAGMLLTTPMYYPYPRLSLPLLASIWLAASGGIAWWIEATLNVERRGHIELTPRRTSFLKRVLTGMVLAAVVLSFVQSQGLPQPIVWQRRTSLRDASWSLAEAALQHASGKFEREPVTLNIDEHGMITPDSPWNNSDDNGMPIPTMSEINQLLALVAPPRDTSSPLADHSDPRLAIYGYGEPAVLGHISAAGFSVAPVQDVSFGPATRAGKPVPTFLVIGPYALRTQKLWDEWATQQDRFEHVADFHFLVSQVVLYNLFSAAWVSQHPECHIQKLELYRLRP